MIKIYGIQIDHLPYRRDLSPLLHPLLYDSWRSRHRNIRDERVTRASLGGLFLLQHAGFTGELTYDENGRPRLVDSNVDFNISHTSKHVFCAIETPDETDTNMLCRVGIDAEELTRLRTLCICPLADRWFSHAEHENFYRSPNDKSFLQIWTHKEAFIKYLGEGLRAMRRLDTVSAPEEYDILFREYRLEDTIIALCHQSDRQAPDRICMIDEESVNFSN